ARPGRYRGWLSAKVPQWVYTEGVNREFAYQEERGYFKRVKARGVDKCHQ
ncbi:unnamed protein product, partial [marine sediment metagenome]